MTAGDWDRLASDVRVAEAPGGRPVLKAYQDTEGVWTIGLGTNLQELVIDAATAERWFREKLDASEHEASIRFEWYRDLTPARQRAIVELVYNLGIPRLLKFQRFMQALAVRDYSRAHDELLDSVWRRQVGPERSGRIAGQILNG